MAGLLRPYQSLQQGQIFVDQAAVPAAPPTGQILLYGASGEPLILAPGATRGTPLFRGVKNWLRNGPVQVYSTGTGSRTCPTTPIRSVTFTSATWHADGFFCIPTGAAVSQQQGAPVAAGGVTSPGAVQVNGAGGCTGYKFGQRCYNLLGSAMANGAKYFTFSGIIFNGSGSAFVPTININTADASNVFTAVTNRATLALASLANGALVRFSLTFQPSSFASIGNGLEFVVNVPAGGATAGSNRFGGFQVNEGGHALDLEILPIQWDILRCQAWVNTSYGYGIAPNQNVGLNGCIQTATDGAVTNQIPGVAYPVMMSLVPEVKIYAGDGTIDRVSTTSSGAPGGPTSVVVSDISSSRFRVVSSSAGSYSLNTHYTYHYQASCELL